VLVEDIDILMGDDKGFWNTLWNIFPANCPIILTFESISFFNLDNPFSTNNASMQFNRRWLKNTIVHKVEKVFSKAYIQLIGCSRNLWYSPETLETFSSKSIRDTILLTDFIGLNSRHCKDSWININEIPIIDQKPTNLTDISSWLSYLSSVDIIKTNTQQVKLQFITGS
jgi:hypothetical protein